MSSSGSTSNNMNNTIDNNKMEHMMDYLAFTVNGKGREMIENLSKIKADMKNVTKKILKENHVCVIPSNVTHSGKALSDCELIDVFCPARTEYSNK